MKNWMREEIIEIHRQLRERYGALFDDLADLLFRFDPIGINFETNKDEYEPEARTILLQLGNCHTIDDVHQMVHQEFVNWFDAGIAGAEINYLPIASEIWKLWKNYNINNP